MLLEKPSFRSRAFLFSASLDLSFAAIHKGIGNLNFGKRSVVVLGDFSITSYHCLCVVLDPIAKVHVNVTQADTGHLIYSRLLYKETDVELRKVSWNLVPGHYKVLLDVTHTKYSKTTLDASLEHYEVVAGECGTLGMQLKSLIFYRLKLNLNPLGSLPIRDVMNTLLSLTYFA